MFDRAVQGLARFPHSGKFSVNKEIRKLLSHPACRPIYPASDDAVTILIVVHTLGQWPAVEVGTS